jgi:hypothetical protein
MREIFRGQFGDSYPCANPVGSYALSAEWYERPWNLNKEIVIVEQEPQRRTIRWYDEEESRPKLRTYHIPLPYIQFIYFNCSLAIACSSKPHRIGRFFRHTPLSNVYVSGKVCQAKAFELDSVIHVFYGSKFDPPWRWPQPRQFAYNVLDFHYKPLLEDYPQHKAKTLWNIGMYERWEQLSVDDMLSVDWTTIDILGGSQQCPLREDPLGNLWDFFRHTFGE